MKPPPSAPPLLRAYECKSCHRAGSEPEHGCSASTIPSALARAAGLWQHHDFDLNLIIRTKGSA